MSDYSKIENEDTLIRDNISKAVINTDVDGYNAYMNKKRNAIRQQKEFNNLKTEVTELKDLVKTLIDKIG